MDFRTLGYSAEEDEEGQTGHPLKPACEHVLGYPCIQTWLSAGSDGANCRSCLTCREELFILRTPLTGSEDLRLDRGVPLTEDEYHSFDANWALLQLDNARNYWSIHKEWEG